MPINLTGLRALDREAQVSVLKTLWHRATSSVGSIHLDEVRSAIGELGHEDRFLELGFDLAGTRAPQLTPIAHTPIRPGWHPLAGLEGASLVEAVKPFGGRRVVLHMQLNQGARVVLAGRSEGAELDTDEQVASLGMSELDPDEAAADRLPGERLFFVEDWAGEHNAAGSPTHSLLVAKRRLITEITAVQEIVGGQPYAPSAASTVDGKVTAREIAQAVYEGRPYSEAPLKELEEKIAAAGSHDVPDEVKVAVEREAKGIESALIRHLVTARLSPIISLLEATPVMKSHGSFEASLRDMREGLLDEFSMAVPLEIGPALDGLPGPLPPHLERPVRRLKDLLAFGQLKMRTRRSANPLERLRGGFRTGFDVGASLALAVPEKFEATFGRFPSPNEYTAWLESSRGLVRHDLPGADLRVFSRWINELTLETGRLRWRMDHLVALGTPQMGHLDFAPDKVKLFKEIHGAFLETHFPETMECPARMLGSIDDIFKGVERIASEAYRIHSERPGGLRLLLEAG